MQRYKLILIIHCLVFYILLSMILPAGGPQLLQTTLGMNLDQNPQAQGLVNWTKIPTTGPSGRIEHQMVFDPSRNISILFGGERNGSPLGDTWIYNYSSQVWTEKTPATSPSARSDQAMTYDPVHDVVIMFGGSKGSYLTSDDSTWIYNIAANTWTEVVSSDPPEIRSGAAMIYYPPTNETLMVFGLEYNQGNYYPSYKADLFDYDTKQWHLASSLWSSSSDVPRNRRGHELLYIEEDQSLYLFGGDNYAGDAKMDDLWRLTAPSQTQVGYWTKMSTNLSPDPGTTFGMAYDPILRKIFVYDSKKEDYMRIYNIDTNSWSLQVFDKYPKVTDVQMNFDPTTGSLFIFGGTTADNGESWRFDYDPQYDLFKFPDTGGVPLLFFAFLIVFLAVLGGGYQLIRKSIMSKIASPSILEKYDIDFLTNTFLGLAKSPDHGKIGAVPHGDLANAWGVSMERAEDIMQELVNTQAITIKAREGQETRDSLADDIWILEEFSLDSGILQKIARVYEAIDVDQLALLLNVNLEMLRGWLQELPPNSGFELQNGIIYIVPENVSAKIDELIFGFQRHEGTKLSKLGKLGKI